MQTQKSMLADAMRLTAEDLDLSIQAVRSAIRRGQQIQRRAQTYLRLLKQASQYRAEGVELGLYGPLFEPASPLPFRTQLVGHTPEQVKALEWKAF